MDNEINGPDGIKDMIGEENVRKIKHMLGVLLRGER